MEKFEKLLELYKLYISDKSINEIKRNDELELLEAEKYFWKKMKMVFVKTATGDVVPFKEFLYNKDKYISGNYIYLNNHVYLATYALMGLEDEDEICIGNRADDVGFPLTWIVFDYKDNRYVFDPLFRRIDFEDAWLNEFEPLKNKIISHTRLEITHYFNFIKGDKDIYKIEPDNDYFDNDWYNYLFKHTPLKVLAPAYNNATVEIKKDKVKKFTFCDKRV